MLQAEPGRSYFAHKDEIDNAVSKVLASQWYILGKECEAFEQDFAKYIGCAHCLGVANGTDALELILRGLGIGKGDKVVTVGNTAVATVAAIGCAGADVRFVDIESEYYTMSPASLEEMLKREVGIKAVIVVHLFGGAADMNALKAICDFHGVFLIEDCAQAHGTEYKGHKCGTYGIASGFSFYPTKNLGAFGDGGAVCTNDVGLYERMKALRQYGWTKRYISEYSGINTRLDEMQAAILSIKLKHLEIAIERRRTIAQMYSEAFSNHKDIETPFERDETKHSYHQYVIRIDRREDLVGYLIERGIGTAIHYPVPIPWQKAYQSVPRIVSLTVTETVNDYILSLPMYPELTDAEANSICSSILSFFK